MQVISFAQYNCSNIRKYGMKKPGGTGRPGFVWRWLVFTQRPDAAGAAGMRVNELSAARFAIICTMR